MAHKERPILFKGDMVKAVLEGRKTQTRRIVKVKPGDCLNTNRIEVGGCYDGEDGQYYGFPSENEEYKCPYGKPGDRLYVRETHYRYGKWVKNGKTKTGKQAWKFKPIPGRGEAEIRFADNPPKLIRPSRWRKLGWYKRPSIFMPRWASRILLEVTGVRVQRVQDVSEEDAEAEGCSGGAVTAYSPWHGREMDADWTALDAFAALWDSINENRGFGWDKNDWVWVVELKRIKP